MADRGYRSMNFDTRDTLFFYYCIIRVNMEISDFFRRILCKFLKKKSLIIKNKNILLNASLASI